MPLAKSTFIIYRQQYLRAIHEERYITTHDV